MSDFLKNDISKNIKNVLVVFLVCFIGLISYITYFQVFKADEISASPYNRRLQAKRNLILRGTIYDRNMNPLTKSKKVSSLNQERTYVYGDIFANVLGYVSPRYGITGLERKYDSVLIGADTIELSKFFQSITEKTDKVGYSLRTTLDSNIQKKAYELLGNNKGAVVALNPRTGEVLAMVSKPSYNPNKLEADWKSISKNKDNPLYNRAIYGLYPPGSTFKIVTAVSALENIKDIKQRTFKDEGKLVFNSNESLKNYNGEVLGNIDFSESFVESSNVVFGGLGIELGNDKLRETAEKFYFNKALPINDFATKQGRFPSLKRNEKGNIAQSAIGQGEVLVSPMQMALVTATIANDGVMMKPFLVKDVLNSEGKRVKKTKTESLGQITSKENAAIMKKFMKKVVEDGTGRNASIDGISVCGKTGTADNESGNKKPHSWFVGFAPYENPQISVVVIVENGGVGGRKAADITREVISAALKK
ncbi:peptidoglycan D,D-transpeptidase FtsI family protein [Clostridium ganghwense]|uniref:Penicillin-binding transpeptidase domain-containing protein n=1 Tax=Clostridium ganghwense TaxID=312089 RepID=A0ABT4CQS0_9CLOT|nr:penicillin-binding transpeptidase domain-containing protein [Clostridium ganghwense]MCY6371268.1 penicillin-binding transpeptidase domain-containing protein [Clostridium ganghwense]